MDSQNTSSKGLTSWLRSFRTSRDSPNDFTDVATTQNNRFARTFRRSLGQEPERNDDASRDMKSNPTRASLMSIRKVWAADAETVAREAKIVGRKSKKPCAKINGQCSPSKIPISPHMKAQQRNLLPHVRVTRDKENDRLRADACETRSASGDSLGSTQSSKMVMKAAMLAKSRRSSCGCHANLNVRSEQEAAFQKAANQIGLPRTSTQTGVLRAGERCRSVPLSPLDNISGIRDSSRERKVVPSTLVTNGTSARQGQSRLEEGVVSARSNVRNIPPLQQALEEGKIPAVPPRTYLLRMAHAKAHLTGTGVPTSHHPLQKTTRHAEAHSRKVARGPEEDVRVCSRGILKNEVVRPTQSNSGRPNVRPAVRTPFAGLQNNPSYGLACRTQPPRRQYCRSESGVAADDENTVLNCSCERCLQKFAGCLGQGWQKKRTSCRNLSRRYARKPRAPSPPDVPTHESKPVQRHCECCNCRAKDVRADVEPARENGFVEREESDERLLDGMVDETFGALKSREDIDKIVELAVKASLEKILSLNIFSSRKKSRSVEDLQTVGQRKVVSPKKYILLSTCTSGRREAGQNLSESGLGASQRSCSVDDLPSAEDVEKLSDELYCTFLELKSKANIKNERLQGVHNIASNGACQDLSPSTPVNLVESSPSFESTKVSTAFIRLIKTENILVCERDADMETTSTHNDGVTSTTKRIACDPDSERSANEVHLMVKGPKTNFADAEAKDALDTESMPSASSEEQRGSLANSSGRNKRSGPRDRILCGYQDMSNMLNPATSSAHCSGDRTIEVASGNCTSTTSTSSLPSRKSPDGWEETPTTDMSVPTTEQDEKSESNLDVVNGEPVSPSDTSTDDQKILEELIRKGMASVQQAKLSPKYPRSPLRSARKYRPRGYFCGKAKLKLAAYTNTGHVTVHIMRATNLVTSLGRPANSYVKVSLQPNSTKRTMWRTAVVKNSRNPDYDQKFSFELMPEDTQRRLLLTVWHRDPHNKHSELLGSMSFAMEKVLRCVQYARGWYRLLKQGLGAKGALRQCL
ncbi:uncharacterized protein LOC135369323 isoform X1 [Ornithodoros turicata]|uniref:uncharacterized protein LOC135369323 isoform X1 n=1 Tax=Ornithodoros turicata TaxID=34597 RepID=UPI003138DB93